MNGTGLTRKRVHVSSLARLVSAGATNGRSNAVLVQLADRFRRRPKQLLAPLERPETAGLLFDKPSAGSW